MNESRKGAQQADRVAAFTGHMVDIPERKTSRFPVSKVPTVGREIATRIRELNIRYGLSSAARGADILFIEELLNQGGMEHVYLPFPRDAFAGTSVGYGWDQRYGRILQDPRVRVVELANALPPPEQQATAYDQCNIRIQEETLRIAHARRAEPVLLAVWNGNPGDDRGGTADAIKSWQHHGHRLEVINLADLK